VRKPTTQNEKGDARTDSANVVFFARDDDDDDAFPILFVGVLWGVFSRPNNKKAFGGDKVFFVWWCPKKERTLKKEKK
jgi:hypothetical protein